MERSREVRRGSMSRRRHRITSLRDSPDRDREVLNENKRRRVERIGVQKRCSREDEEGGGDVDSTDDTSPSCSSNSNQSHRRNITRARGAVQSPSVLRITDEMVIGVPVPRKARSASAKRSHENWSFNEQQRHRKFSASPVTVGRGMDVATPSSSSGSLKNKKTKSVGIKTRLRVSCRSTKPSSSIQDDIEIEVAEALFDLMKQSHSYSHSKSESSMKQERSCDVNKAAEDKSICSPVDIIGANSEDVAVSLQSGSITEIKADNEEALKMETESCLIKPESVLSETITAERIELKKQQSLEEHKDSNEGSVGRDMVLVTKEEEESRPCAKSNADNPVGSASSKANSPAKVIEKKQEGRFEIDLMASPPERDGLFYTASDHPRVVVQEVQMKSEMVVKTEDKLVGEGQEEKKMEISYFKRGSSKLDLEMPYQEYVGTSSPCKPQQEGEKETNQCQAPILGRQKFAKSSSSPIPIAGTGWPTGLPHPGCMPPLQMAMPVDGSARSLTALQQLLPFSLSKPRPKRCATHQYIARNIQFHRKLTKNSMWPAVAGAATLVGAKPHNLKPLLLAQNMITKNTSQGDFPGQQTSTTVSGLSGTDKSSGASNNVDTTNGKKLMLQQGLLQVPAANMHGQALIFQLGQHHTSTAPTNQSGPPKSASALGIASVPSDSSKGAPASSSACPAGTAAVTFNHANFPSNAAPPYMAIFPNNGYPFSFSTNVGAPPPTRGGPQATIMPFFNGSYHSSPMFHISQSQPQQSHSQRLVQTSLHSTSTSSGLSSSLVQPHGQRQIIAQINRDTYFPPMSMLLQQSENQKAPPSHSAGKPAAESSQKDDVLVADSRASHSQKSNSSQNFMVPIQPINLAYMTPGTLKGNIRATSSNHSDQQQQGSKGGVQLIPQAFGLSFSSTASTTSALDASSMAQNPAVFQMLPDMGRQAYQFAPGTQMTPQKNFQMPEGKIIVGSIGNVEERKGTSTMGKSSVSAGQSLNGPKSSCTETSTSTLMRTAVIDSSGRTVSFVQLPISGSQTFPSSSTLPMTVVSANTSNSQQHHHQQLIHLQKHHQQMQLTGTAQLKEPNSDDLPCAFFSTSSLNNYPVFSQTLVQTSSSAQSSHLKYLPSSQVSSPFNASSLKDICQQPWNDPQGQTHIAFGSSSNISTAFHGQQVVSNNHSTASLVRGSPPNRSISKGTSGNSNTAPASSKSGPTIAALPAQLIETSRGAPSKKSSPVCGKNVQSILSTCPSQLS